MSYRRSFWEKMNNFFSYRSWKPPVFPADGIRQSVTGNVFEQYINTAKDIEGSDTAEGVNSSSLIHFDEQVVVFQDRSPVAPFHLLVIPREPIRDVLSLAASQTDIALLNHMKHVGQEALRKLGAKEPYILGFHIPPYNSIPHLHLHCISGKLNLSGKFKIGDPIAKHFITVNALVEQLTGAMKTRSQSSL